MGGSIELGPPLLLEFLLKGDICFTGMIIICSLSLDGVRLLHPLVHPSALYQTFASESIYYKLSVLNAGLGAPGTFHALSDITTGP